MIIYHHQSTVLLYTVVERLSLSRVSLMIHDQALLSVAAVAIRSVTMRGTFVYI